MLTVSSASGPGNANGVVNGVNSGGAVTSGALPHTFVYTPRWFTNLGPEATVEQRYAATDLVVAGQWRGTVLRGQAAAAGQASVVRGQDERGPAWCCSAPSRCSATTRRACTARSPRRCCTPA